MTLPEIAEVVDFPLPEISVQLRALVNLGVVSVSGTPDLQRYELSVIGRQALDRGHFLLA